MTAESAFAYAPTSDESEGNGPHKFQAGGHPSRPIAKIRPKPKPKSPANAAAAAAGPKVTATGRGRRKQDSSTPAAAASRARPGGNKSSSDDSDDSELALGCAAGCVGHFSGTRPLTSGVFNYVDWAVGHVLTLSQRDAIARQGDPSRSPASVSVGSMCTGMGTEEVALDAIVEALLKHGGRKLETVSHFKAEADPVKLDFLQRDFPKTRQWFCDKKDLAKDLPTDSKGEAASRPSVDGLARGIVCKDISGLNVRPKSERAAAGVSGASLQGLLGYVAKEPFASRPKSIILKCVSRLGQKRRVDPDGRKGTEYISEELGKLGYVGRWRNVSPRTFFLPQSRPRVYGLFLLKRRLDTEGERQRELDQTAAAELLSKLQVPVCEPLVKVLGRLPATPDGSAPKASRSAAGVPAAGL